MGDDFKNEAECCSSSIPESSNILQRFTTSSQSPPREKHHGKYKRKERNGDKEERHLKELLGRITTPTVDLPPLDRSEKKFCSKNRLFVGALPSNSTDGEMKELFGKYGELADVFVNPTKNFGFITMDYYINALKAKTELHGSFLKGKHLIVNFAQTATVFIRNLPPDTSDELLYLGFSVFGDIEHCAVITDAHGRPTGQATVRFAKKGSAMLAKKRCAEDSFFLTSCLKPLIVEDYQVLNEVDGFSEKQVNIHDGVS